MTGNADNLKPASAAGILTFAVDGRPRANRSKNSKSRSGCVTCKKRRIRCDETKPSCSNCAKSKRTCEGYIQRPPPGERTKLTGEARPLLIKPNYESHLFTDQLQKDHFQYWMAFTKEFTLFPTDLMAHLIPQIARHEPAVRYAAFAIGAATMGSDSRQQRTSGTGPFMEEALKHYGRAIQIIRNSEASRRSVPRAILSCLLFVTFESLQGNHKAALTHINHGCSMLDQVTRQGVCGECPPKLVDEVYTAFRRFTLLSWSVNGYHPQETKTFVPWCCKGRRSRYAIDEMPPSFSDLLEARRWWEIVQHHIIYKTNMKSGLRFEDVLTPTTKSNLSLAEAKTYLDLLERWRDRFKPLMKGAARRRSSNPQAYLQMVSLRLMYVSLELALNSCHYTDLEVLASSTAEFKVIVSLSRIMLASQSTVDSPKEVFTMDTGPSWPLLVAGVFCTDESTREEALQLLRDYPRRDGLWDSKAFATILQGSQFLRAQKNSSYKEHWAEVFLDKEIVIGDNEIRRRRYGLDENGHVWHVETEERYPIESE